MIMLGDKKKVASQIVASIHRASDSMPEVPAEKKDWDSEGLLMAAQEVLKAVEERDVIRLRDALKAAYYSCEGVEDSYESEVVG